MRMFLCSVKNSIHLSYFRLCKGLGSRRYSIKVRREFVVDLVKGALERTTISSVSDWNVIRQEILQNESNKGQYSIQNIDAMILNYCLTNNVKLGLSYVDFMKKEKIKTNFVIIGKWLHLMYSFNENYLKEGNRCPKSQENIILECYRNLRNEYPVLDPVTLENCIFALSLTSDWKMCLDILKELEIVSISSNKCYSVIIAAAFLNNHCDLAWNLLEDMVLRDAMPTSLPFLTYINLAKKSLDAKTMLENLLVFFQDTGIICKEDVILNLENSLKYFGLRGSAINIGQKGHCKSCAQTLEKYELSTAEFEDLKTLFFENVIIGRDVFLRTNPEELEIFKKFVNKMENYDIVMDGLNVAYSAGKQSSQILSALVATVVSYFVQQNKKILLLGRKHMNNWPQKNWGYVLKNATVFLTQNISQDDPYFLYCALHSGKDTIVVTRDLMRSHKFRLKSPKHKALFSRWLSQRQYQLLTVNSLGRPIFRFPPPFNVITQKNGDFWHIPYEVQGNNNNFHKTWFCLKWK